VVTADGRRTRHLCLPTAWHGETVLRLAFVNPATEARHAIKALETLR